MKEFPLKTSIWIVLAFSVLHALICLACRSMGVVDTQALTLLTLAMVFILCTQCGFKIYFILVALVMINVLAYLIGNALPALFIPVIGDNMWVHVISTTITTLILGFLLIFVMGYFVKNPLFVNRTDEAGPEQVQEKAYRQRWIVRLGDRIVPVPTEKIAYFYSKDKCNYLLTKEGDRYIVDATMDAIMEDLAPENFFRINRSCILSLSSIDSALVSGGRYTVEIHPKVEDIPSLVTRSREDEFLRWLEKD